MHSEATLLYLHIPKAGGTTLSECIHYQCRGPEPNKGEEDPDYPGRFMFHEGIYYFWRGFFKEPDLRPAEHVLRALAREDLRAVVGHFSFGIHEYVRGPWVYVTMLREPVERTVSLYWHAVDSSFRRPLTHRVEIGLHEFVRNPPFREVDNDQTRRIAGEEPAVSRCTRAMLERAKDNLRRHFRVVGVTERFDETLVLMKQAFGWRRSLRYYPRNQTRRRLPAASLPRETLDAIRQRNELDLELYRFAHELLDEAIALGGVGFREEMERFRALQQQWRAADAEELGKQQTDYRA